MAERNLKILPRFSDGTPFLYVEKAIIERQDNAIAVYTKDGTVAVPAASLATLVLGPGTRITHAAMMALAECGTSVVWSGTDLQRFYAAGIGKSRSSQTILKQAVAWANEDSRMDVVKRLYRFRFAEELPDDLTLQQIRGHEGVRVRDAYSQASNRFGIDWQGRNYSRDDWTTADPANRALSAGATCLYGVCHGAIMARGYSPAIGFIHHGKQLSFVYDIADLYKVEILIPAAFEVAASGERSVERATRTLLRERMHQAKLLDRAVYDLDRLFVEVTKGIAVADLDADDAPGGLWDPTGIVEGGKNYGGDDA